MIIIALFILICSIINLLINNYHFLSILLNLEVATLALFLLIYYQRGLWAGDNTIALAFIVVGASEAALGLAVLVILVRLSRNDFICSLTKW